MRFEGAGNCSLAFQFQASDWIIHRYIEVEQE